MVEKTLTITYYREVLRNEDDLCVTVKNKNGSDKIVSLFSGLEAARLYNFLAGRNDVFYGNHKKKQTNEQSM